MRIGLKEERCSGCAVCEIACSFSLFGEINPRKSAIRVTADRAAPGRYRVLFCEQCGECARACPAGCIQRAGGAWRIDPHACTGCMECVGSCPNGAMRTHPGEKFPFKCVLCGECLRLCPRSAVYDLDGEMAERRWY